MKEIFRQTVGALIAAAIVAFATLFMQFAIEGGLIRIFGGATSSEVERISDNVDSIVKTVSRLSVIVEEVSERIDKAHDLIRSHVTDYRV